MECMEAMDLISARLDDTLTDAESRQLDDHLRSCSACRDLLADFEAIHEAMPGLSTAPEGLSRQIMDQVHQSGIIPIPVRTKSVHHWKAWASAAAVLALVIAGGGLLKQNSSPAAPVALSSDEAPAAEARSVSEPGVFSLNTSTPEGPFCGRLTLPAGSVTGLESDADFILEDGTQIFILPADQFALMAEKYADPEGTSLETAGSNIDPDAPDGLLIILSSD